MPLMWLTHFIPPETKPAAEESQTALFDRYIQFIGAIDPTQKTPFIQPELNSPCATLKTNADFLRSQKILSFLSTPENSQKTFAACHQEFINIKNQQLKKGLKELILFQIKATAQQNFEQLITPPECKAFSYFINAVTNIKIELEKNQIFVLLKSDSNFTYSFNILEELQKPQANLTLCHKQAYLIQNPSLQSSLNRLLQQYTHHQTYNNDVTIEETSPTVEEPTHLKTGKALQTAIEEMKRDMKFQSTRRFCRSVTLLGFIPHTLEGPATGIQTLQEKITAVTEDIYTNKVKSNNLLNDLTYTLEERFNKSYSSFWPIAKVRTKETQEFYTTWLQRLTQLKENAENVSFLEKTTDKAKDVIQRVVAWQTGK